LEIKKAKAVSRQKSKILFIPDEDTVVTWESREDPNVHMRFEDTDEIVARIKQPKLQKQQATR
jgi:hypothetical protein